MAPMAPGKHTTSPQRPGKRDRLARAMRNLLRNPGSPGSQSEVDEALAGCTPEDYEAAWALATPSGAPVKFPRAGGGRRPAVVAAFVTLIAVGLGVYAAAASYDTVSHLAAAKGVALPRLNPIGIDGGLAGVIILDIVASWLDEPIWWLRLAARVFAAGTVAANASAGWPDSVGTGLRVAAPLLFVVITEAGRTLLLRHKKAEERKRKHAARLARRAARRAARDKRRGDRIPVLRWLLDFRGTLAIWRRMKLWQEPSYKSAVSMELERLAAIERLTAAYHPIAWRHKAPADLVWMLTSGVRMTEALARVSELVSAEARDRGLEAEVRKLRAGREAEVAEARAELGAVIGRLETELGEVRRETETAAEQAEELTRKLAAATRKRSAGNGGNGSRKPEAGSARKDGNATGRKAETGRPVAPALSPEDLPGNWDELDTEARVLFLVNEKGFSGSRAGIEAGVTDARGRQIARVAKGLSGTAPQDVVGGAGEAGAP